MDSTLAAAGIGATAGIATGLGGALIARWNIRVQVEAAAATRREQWRAEHLRTSYSEVITSFRQLMMAWWRLCHLGPGRRNAGAAALYDEVTAGYTAFTSACAAAILLASPSVQHSIELLRDAVVDFDKAAEDLDLLHHDPRGEITKDSPYELARQGAEDRQREFIEAAREDPCLLPSRSASSG